MATVKTFSDTKIFSCNVYVVSSEKGIIVIDPGYYDGDFRGYVRQLRQIDAILLTHGHIDYVRRLDAQKMDFPNAPAYIGSKEQSFLADPNMPCSSILKIDGFKVNTVASPLDEGQYHFAAFEVETILTPGHSFGSLTYIFREENVMFTGDALMHFSKTPTDRPTGKSKIATLRCYGFSIWMFAGHGGLSGTSRISDNGTDAK